MKVVLRAGVYVNVSTLNHHEFIRALRIPETWGEGRTDSYGCFKRLTKICEKILRTFWEFLNPRQVFNQSLTKPRISSFLMSVNDIRLVQPRLVQTRLIQNRPNANYLT